MKKESPKLLNAAAVYRVEEVLPEIELKSFLASLGSRIKQLRKERELTMRDIMVRIGYYDAQWRNYEGGGSALTIASLMKIAIALQVSLSELFGPLGQWPLLSVAAIQRQGGISQEIKLKPGRKPKRTLSAAKPVKGPAGERQVAASRTTKAHSPLPEGSSRRSRGGSID